jgi:hypothetical protein
MEAPAPSRHARLSAGRLNLSRHIINPPALARLRQSRGLARVSTVVDLQVQTCEPRGCYASTPIAPDLLAALKSGKQLKVSFQNLAKETMTIPMPLADFAVAYDRIK